MRNQKVLKLEQAINTIQYAKYQIREALLDTDVARDSIDLLNEAILDLEADIAELEQMA